MTQVWAAGEAKMAACKGAPEAIIALCKLAPDRQAAVMAEVTEMAASGVRVLGLAVAEVADEVTPMLMRKESQLAFRRLTCRVLVVNPAMSSGPKTVWT
jgi:magnesium-transporting ATPase (P-type)